MSNGVRESAKSWQERTEVPEAFGPFIDAAVVRLVYLYPHARFERDGLAVIWTIDGGASAAQEIRRDLFFQLYRERIYAETLDVRKRIYDVR